MRDPDDGDITVQLRAWSEGDEAAFARLVASVYPELKRLARRQLARGRPGETLNTTGLVHEAYLKLVDRTRADIHDRQHFFRLAARVMRQIVVDTARGRARLKRGGGVPPLSVEAVQPSIEEHAAAVLEVDEVLGHLADLEQRLAQVVECRFFAGLTLEETAETLAISTATVERDWSRARAWLKKALTAELEM
jgi:RNA polymerase sigma factor (TIGR02999 family)